MIIFSGFAPSPIGRYDEAEKNWNFPLFNYRAFSWRGYFLKVKQAVA